MSRTRAPSPPVATPASTAAVSLLSYPIHVAPGALDDVGTIVRRVAPAHRYVLVSDTNVAPLYAGRVVASFAGDRVDRLQTAAGESHKTREQWIALTDAVIALGCGRDTTILALGGGVVGDLAGFVAATFMRGVPFVQLPTTLLAMIDASIGGKTGVDTPAGKNLVGAFHQPRAVIADPDVLSTLPLAERRSGCAEAIKHGVIADAAYFDRLCEALPLVLETPAGEAMHDLIRRSIEIKCDIVWRDERESGRRKVLNFGHTLGHAIEATTDYAMLHGDAVAIGMVLEAALAERLGVAEPGTAAAVRAAVARAGLPGDLPAGVTPSDVVAATRGDKKARAGITEYALPLRIGAMAGEARGWAVPVEEREVLEVLQAH